MKLAGDRGIMVNIMLRKIVFYFLLAKSIELFAGYTHMYTWCSQESFAVNKIKSQETKLFYIIVVLFHLLSMCVDSCIIKGPLFIIEKSEYYFWHHFLEASIIAAIRECHVDQK